MKPQLLSVRQTAEYLNVSIRTVRRLIEDGRLKTVLVRSRRMVPFGRIYGLKPTATYHTEMRIAQVDIGKIAFEGLPGPRRKAQCKKDIHGKFAPKYKWPEVERQKQLGPIGRLIHNGIDLSRFL